MATPSLAQSARRLCGSEWPFVVALGGAVVVRVLVQYAFPPGFVFSDGPTYLGFVDELVPSPDRPIGYGVMLWLLSGLTRGVDAITILQHVLGLLTAVLAYALLRRWGVSRWVATLALLPLLFDEMELVLEHSVLSDVLFDFLVVCAVVALAWRRRPPWWATAAAGVLLGAATIVRLVGEPALVAAAVFLLWVGTTWRWRLLQVAVVVLAYALPVTAYMAWYAHANGTWAITESSGRALYMRTTTFVDCSRFSMPDYERPLCPSQPVGHRQDPTDYGWHNPAVFDLQVPAGSTANQVMKDFAERAIRAQPGAYLTTVARDFAMTFWAPDRSDRYDYDTAHKWGFHYYLTYRPSATWGAPAYAAHGGETLQVRRPVADWLDWYGQNVFVRGPMLLVLLGLAIAGLVVRRRPDASPTRALNFLLLLVVVGVTLEPDATAEFVWRYQLPCVVLLPMSAALAWTRLRTPGRRRAPTDRTAG
jgi:4-amino-4-deoxy-L-arabinose transferase-like glycosyltransferase